MRPALRVAHRGHDARRLVQEKIGRLGRRRNGLAVDLDAIAGIDERSQLAHDVAVDADASACDQLVARPPRRHAACARYLLSRMPAATLLRNVI